MYKEMAREWVLSHSCASTANTVLGDIRMDVGGYFSYALLLEQGCMHTLSDLPSYPPMNDITSSLTV